jgi:hypothetical protein
MGGSLLVCYIGCTFFALASSDCLNIFCTKTHTDASFSQPAILAISRTSSPSPHPRPSPHPPPHRHGNPNSASSNASTISSTPDHPYLPHYPLPTSFFSHDTLPRRPPRSRRLRRRRRGKQRNESWSSSLGWFWAYRRRLRRRMRWWWVLSGRWVGSSRKR